MEIDFLGLKKKRVSELVGRKTETGGDSGHSELCAKSYGRLSNERSEIMVGVFRNKEGGGLKWMSSIPGCSYSGLNGHLLDSSQQNFTSLGKKSYCKAFNLNFSQKGVPAGVMNKCVGSSTSPPQDANAIERKNSKLTMFYADSVYVFDDVSPKKAKAILSMAEHDRYPNFELPKVEVSKKVVGRLPPPSSATDSSRFKQETHAFGIPQARKASLFRFLEKRKHRLKGVIPFNLTTNPSSSSDYSYHLGSASFMHRENH